MNSLSVMVGVYGAMHRFSRVRSWLMSGSSCSGGDPSSVFLCAGEVVSHENSVERGGIVHGVPCADPK